MSFRYVKLNENNIVTQESFLSSELEATDMVLVENSTLANLLGYSYVSETGDFIAPLPIAPPIAIIDFVDLLTDDEYEIYLDLISYDKNEAKTDKQKSIRVKRAIDKLEREPVAVDNFTTVAGVLVTENVLTQLRFDEIIAGLTA